MRLPVTSMSSSVEHVGGEHFGGAISPERPRGKLRVGRLVARRCSFVDGGPGGIHGTGRSNVSSRLSGPPKSNN